MIIAPKSMENKEKANNPWKENNKDNEKVSPDLKSISTPKKLFMTSTIFPPEDIPSPKSINIASKIQFIVSTVHENIEKIEKENNRNNPFLIYKIKDSKLNIFNNYIIFN